MKLIDDWKCIVRRAWSIRLMALVVLLCGAEVVLPFMADLMPRWVFATLTGVVAIGAAWARLVPQKGLGNAE